MGENRLRDLELALNAGDYESLPSYLAECIRTEKSAYKFIPQIVEFARDFNSDIGAQIRKGLEPVVIQPKRYNDANQFDGLLKEGKLGDAYAFAFYQLVNRLRFPDMPQTMIVRGSTLVVKGAERLVESGTGTVLFRDNVFARNGWRVLSSVGNSEGLIDLGYSSAKELAIHAKSQRDLSAEERTFFEFPGRNCNVLASDLEYSDVTRFLFRNLAKYYSESLLPNTNFVFEAERRSRDLPKYSLMGHRMRLIRNFEYGCTRELYLSTSHDGMMLWMNNIAYNLLTPEKEKHYSEND